MRRSTNNKELLHHELFDVMSSFELDNAGLASSFDDVSTPLSQSQRSSALTTRITSVLSTSYVDADMREALRTLDENHVQNTPKARRRLRLDIQKEVIDRNGEIVRDFGQVAEVRAI